MADLECLLLRLNQFGRPGVSRMRDGWWCRCEMFVQAKGAEVRIDSDMNHPSPTEAAQVCLDRVSTVVRDISKLAEHKALPHG